MKVIVQNLSTEYQDCGTGRVILLLHGWKDSLATFDALVPYLAENFRVVRLDLPGFGATQFPQSNWNLESYAQFVEAFIAKLQLDVYALVGHSFGGRIAIKGVSEKKILPKKLILIASAGIITQKTIAKRIIRFATKIGNMVFFVPPLSFFKTSVRKRLYALLGSDYETAGALQPIFLNVIDEDLQKAASTIKIPTLLIWGQKDTQTPLAYADTFNKSIIDSKLEVIPDGTHFVHREFPDMVLHKFEAFL